MSYMGDLGYRITGAGCQGAGADERTPILCKSCMDVTSQEAESRRTCKHLHEPWRLKSVPPLLLAREPGHFGNFERNEHSRCSRGGLHAWPPCHSPGQRLDWEGRSP